MDIVSQPTAQLPPLDVTGPAPPLASSRLRLALLAGSVLALAAGLVGLFLWAQVAWIRVESNPPGALVFADGRPVGETPLLLSALGSARWRLRIEAPGYTPWETSAALEPRRDARLIAALVPLPGSLILESVPSGATVELDGDEVGQTPIAIPEVAAGVHRLALTVADYADWVMQVQIPSSGVASHRISLIPLPARLDVSTSAPGATVSVDGAPRGPAGADVSVSPGQRTIRVEAPGYRPWQRLIELSPNERRSIEAELGVSWVEAARHGVLSPLAVIVENEAHARPQAGLDRADVVYEALAEGGITRFLAIYASLGAEVVGPVRSARDYLVEWAHEYGAPLVHIGASPQGYDAIRALRVSNLDEIRGHPGFWRSEERSAPHNAYTSVGGARAALGPRGVVRGSYGGLEFVDNPPARAGPPVSEVTIHFGGWLYTAGWSYDPRTNEYLRDMDNEPHVDAESGEQLRATAVLLQWVDSWLIPGDREGRLALAQVGSGRLVALVDGVTVEGQWQKDSPMSPTRYLQADGSPLLLRPGPVWIQVVPPSGSVTF